MTGGHTYDTTFYTLFDYPDLTWDHATSNRAAFRKDVRENYDAVLLYNMEQKISDASRGNLQAFIESGRGVVVLAPCHRRFRRLAVVVSRGSRGQVPAEAGRRRARLNLQA